MIIIRYLVQEILKSQLAILFILLLIFFCQKFVRILDATVDGKIPTNLVITLLWLGIPEMAQLVLPLSLFLAILMALERLYSESEIIVMYACGIGKLVLIKAVGIMILMTMLLVIINVVWLSPCSSRYQSEVKQNSKINLGTTALVAGRFQQSSDGNNVLFIESVKGNQFGHSFFVQLRSEDKAYPSIVIAESGHIERRMDGSQVVTLDKGTCFEESMFSHNFRITTFTNYQALIGYKITSFNPSDADQVDFIKLLRNPSSEFRSGLHWRLTLVFSVLVMALIAFPISIVYTRQNRAFSMFPAILLYFTFFLLQSSLKSNCERGRLDPAIWMWVVNLSYLSLAIAMNLWDTVPIRRLRASALSS